MSLNREGIFTSVAILTGHEKSYGWEIFFAPILTTGSTKELLGYLSDIKTWAERISAANDSREKEDEQLYTFLIVSLTLESINTVSLQQLEFNNSNYCSVTFIFKVIVSKYHFDSQSTITLLIVKITTGISDIMASFGEKKHLQF